MEVAGIALSAIETILSALESPHLKKILSIYGYESKLVELQHTVNTINNVLLDADAKQELSNVAQQLIEDLKDVVFEAEDLLDEFVTLTKQNEHLEADGITISKKMKRFLSRSNPLLVARKMSKGVDKIRKKLDAFAYNKQFMMEFNHEPIKFRKPETCSYVDNFIKIVGREGDLEHIVGGKQIHFPCKLARYVEGKPWKELEQEIEDSVLSYFRRTPELLREKKLVVSTYSPAYAAPFSFV